MYAMFCFCVGTLICTCVPNPSLTNLIMHSVMCDQMHIIDSMHELVLEQQSVTLRMQVYSFLFPNKHMHCYTNGLNLFVECPKHLAKTFLHSTVTPGFVGVSRQGGP
jgi:hypothetical protein